MADIPQRRVDDKRLESLIKVVSDHVEETRTWRCETKRSLSGLRDDFFTFSETYGPMLQEALERRNWFAKRWDEAKSELVKRGMQASVFAIIGLISLGFWLKAQNFILSMLGLASK